MQETSWGAEAHLQSQRRALRQRKHFDHWPRGNTGCPGAMGLPEGPPPGPWGSRSPPGPASELGEPDV